MGSAPTAGEPGAADLVELAGLRRAGQRAGVGFSKRAPAKGTAAQHEQDGDGDHATGKGASLHEAGDAGEGAVSRSPAACRAGSIR